MAKVAVMGFGVVGSGVCEVLVNNQEHIAKKTGERLDLKYILDVRDLSDSPYADRVVHDFSIIENDPEVDIVVETIGRRSDLQGIYPAGAEGGQERGYLQ